MFLLRKIGKLLRGAATPFQVHLACVLGAMLGFVPSFTRSPALVIGLVLLLLVFNANLFVATLAASFGKLASLALMGVSFGLGRDLLDGPPRAFFVKLINAPVFAYCGFEWYVGTGGLLLGVLFGVIAGFVVTVPLKTFRAAMGKVEDRSNFYNRHKKNPFLRFFFFVLFGSRHHWDSYRELLDRKVGNPIRIWGAAIAAAIVALVWWGQGRLTEPLLTRELQAGLQSANGATVDLGRVELDLANGRLAIHELALADSEALDTDLFRAKLLECDVSGVDLLRKRLKLDRVVARDAEHGAKRATPGVRTSPPPEPSPPPTAKAGEKTLDDYLATAKTWKQRLTQAKEWLDQMKRKPGPSPADEPTLKERLEQEVERNGWREVAAAHLIEGAPLFTIGELIVEGMKSDSLDGRPLDLKIENLSTNPGLLDGAPRLTLGTRDGLLKIDVGLGSEARRPGQSFIDLRCAGLSTTGIAAALAAKSGEQTVQGGTLDAGFRLAWSAGGSPVFDTPLNVLLKDTNVTLPKLGAAKVKELAIPLTLRGPLDNPQIGLDAKQLADNLVKAGANELGDKLKQEVQQRVDAATEEAKQKAKSALDDAAKKGLDQAGDAAKKALDGLGGFNPFGDKKKDDKKKDGEQDEKPKPNGGGGG